MKFASSVSRGGGCLSRSTLFLPSPCSLAQGLTCFTFIDQPPCHLAPKPVWVMKPWQEVGEMARGRRKGKGREESGKEEAWAPSQQVCLGPLSEVIASLKLDFSLRLPDSASHSFLWPSTFRGSTTHWRSIACGPQPYQHKQSLS